MAIRVASPLGLGLCRVVNKEEIYFSGEFHLPEDVETDFLCRLFIFWPRCSQKFEFGVVQAAMLYISKDVRGRVNVRTKLCTQHPILSFFSCQFQDPCTLHSDP